MNQIKKLKKSMVASTNLVLVSTSAKSTESVSSLDHLMLWNIMVLISREIMNIGYFSC